MERRLTIDAIPSSMNVVYRQHWRTRNAERKLWADKVGIQIIAAFADVKEWPLFDCKCRVILHYKIASRTYKQRYDLDNLYPKHIIDGMKGYFWPDDNANYITELIQLVSHGCDMDETLVIVQSLDDGQHQALSSVLSLSEE